MYIGTGQVFVAFKEGQKFQGALAEMLGMEAGARPGALMQALVELVSTCSALMEGTLPADEEQVRQTLCFPWQTRANQPKTAQPLQGPVAVGMAAACSRASQYPRIGTQADAPVRACAGSRLRERPAG